MDGQMVGVRNNRRAKYTQQIIKEAVLSLLQEKPVEAITVTEVCELADINRTTFYRYYKDIPDCEEQIETEFIDSLNIPEEFTPFQSLEALLSLFYENPKLSNLAFVEGKTRLLEKMHQVLAPKPRPENSVNSYQGIYVMAGLQNVLKSWVKQGMKESPHELTCIIERLLFAEDIRPMKKYSDYQKYLDRSELDS
ncbi:TetR/AcrR family transcriptional regulator [Companilactobacillus zhongbaensis]|uniref:TetR/AcrR family transcriptional regulator n=1 Tax=Companilactobacillus zhongbaensis TaxID=2486009 RepID=UPI001CDD6BAE|nr:TetR/AcrR family transcriptional regulator [Companilactobacillus zhongbaensis]